MATKVQGQVLVSNFPDAAAGSLADPYHVVVDSLPSGASSVVDVSDRSGRLLGEVSFGSAQHVIVDSAPAAGADVTDRVGRLLGHVNVDNFPATQPVSLATNTPDVTDRSARLLGHITVDNWPATQPISAAALPLPSGAATDSNLNTIQGSAGTSPPSLATSASGLLGWLRKIVDTLAGGLAVTGTFWQATQPVSLATNTPDVTDRAARLLGHVTVDNASLAVTAAALPLPSGAATDSNLTTVGGAAGTSPPALAASASGLIGWLRKIVDTLTAGIAVTGTFWQATQPVSGTFWQATQPVSAASLPLPSGASTSAKQPALGTAGSASADVLSVQGVASMTALKTDGSGVTQPVSGTVTANAGTNLNTSALATSANLTAGTAKAQVTDGTNTAAVKAASTAPAAADPALVVALSPNMGPVSNSLLPSAAATINATVVKGSAGRLYKIKGYNAKAAVVYLKFWNKATTPAPGTDAALIIFSFPLKASEQFDIDLTPVGFAFATGIGYTLSTGSANTDVTALVAADVVGLNVMYA